MDFNFNDGTFVAISMTGIVLLVALLVTLFYKPKKRLRVEAKFNPNNNHIVEIHATNIGKRRVKVVAPYVKFSHGQKSRKYQVSPSKLNTKFPRVLKVGDELKCEVDLTHFHSVLEQKSLKSSHVKIIIENMVGMKYNSRILDYEF